MIRLFLEEKEVELTEDFACNFTKQFEEISNPTVITNDYSKTVTIPFTQANDALFGYLYNPDRLTATGGWINYDPYKKVDMRVEWNDTVLLTGYAKFIRTTANGYEVTLNGELGKIFQELQKITFEKTDDDYYLDSSEWVNTKINRQLVYDSWNSDGQLSLDLAKIGERGYRVTDIIGFIPNNSFNEGFDYKTYQYTENKTKTLAETLDEQRYFNGGATFYDLTGLNGESVYGDGILPRELGEYRSYLQTPFIYFNKLWKIFQSKAELITGYKFNLDPKWFSSSNPYWAKTCFVLNGFPYSDTGLDLSTANFSGSTYPTANSFYVFDHSFGSTDYYTPLLAGTRKTLDLTPTSITKKTNDMISLDRDYIEFEDYSLLQGNLPVYCYINNNTTGAVLTLDSKTPNMITVEMLILDLDGNQLDRVYLGRCIGTTTSENATGGILRYKPNKNIVCNEGQSYCSWSLPVNYTFNSEKLGTNQVKIRFRTGWEADYNPFETISGNAGTVTDIRYGIGNLAYTNDWKVNDFSLDYSYIETNRSNSTFTLNTLWDNTVKPFEVILNYCKAFRILITANETNKTLNFTQSTNYFSDYTIEDWNDRLDRSQEFVVNPITFENKYILFNYEDNNTALGEQYKTDYGLTYGDYRVVTQYNFDSSSKSLFSGLKAGIMNTPSVLSWSSTYDEGRVVYLVPLEESLCNYDADRKHINQFGVLLFDGGKKAFDPELRKVDITDDSIYQIGLQSYFYNQYEGLRTNYYHTLTEELNGELIYFNRPLESFQPTKSFTAVSIYETYWSNYIAERYNTQNKIVTCWVRLDWNNFDFRHFVTIGNQLYIVNKIYDYNPSNEFTKVDLITIQNISGYTELGSFLTITRGNKSLPSEINYAENDSDTWIISSSSDWEWVDLDSSLQEFTINGEYGSGTGSKGTTVLHIEIDRGTEGNSGIIQFRNSEGLITGTEIYINGTNINNRD